MSKKKKADRAGFVYSTDPAFQFKQEPAEQTETLAAAQQKLRVLLDKKQRAGKSVTIVSGFIGTGNDLDELGKKLKTYCGTGGTVKDGEILIQGDQRDKVMQWLMANGFKQAKRI
jgi:translation initiation factor 1